MNIVTNTTLCFMDMANEIINIMPNRMYLYPFSSKFSDVILPLDITSDKLMQDILRDGGKISTMTSYNSKSNISKGVLSMGFIVAIKESDIIIDDCNLCECIIRINYIDVDSYDVKIDLYKPCLNDDYEMHKIVRIYDVCEDKIYEIIHVLFHESNRLFKHKGYIPTLNYDAMRTCSYKLGYIQ